MKCSKAMEKGSHMVRHVAGTTNDGNGGRCAIGMAQIAIQDRAHIGQEWPWTMSVHTDLPCGCTGMMMGGGCIQINHGEGKNLGFLQALVHLFNYHVMTTKDWDMPKLLKWVACVEDHVASSNVEELIAK